MGGTQVPIGAQGAEGGSSACLPATYSLGRPGLVTPGKEGKRKQVEGGVELSQESD